MFRTFKTSFLTLAILMAAGTAQAATVEILAKDYRQFEFETHALGVDAEAGTAFVAGAIFDRDRGPNSPGYNGGCSSSGVRCGRFPSKIQVPGLTFESTRAGAMVVVYRSEGRAVVCGDVKYERPPLGLIKDYVVHPKAACKIEETRVSRDGKLLRVLNLVVSGL